MAALILHRNMRLLKAVCLLTLLTRAAGDVAFNSSTRLRFRPERPRDNGPELAGDPVPGPLNPPPANPPDVNTPWGKAVCRGARLHLAMTLGREGAARHVTPLDSPWDGDLVREMATWGYKDMTDINDVDEHCDFLWGHFLEHAFKALGISTEPASKGGPNKCYKWIHRDGPAVQKTPPPEEKLPPVENQKYIVAGKEYRVRLCFAVYGETTDSVVKVTGAEYIMGVNAQDGLVYFINLLSPVQSAMQLWKTPNPSKDDLPAIRSSSDVAWGLWNRAVNSKGKDVKKITKFMSLTITNDETAEIITEALGRWKVLPGQPQLEDPLPWPGTTYDTTSEEGQALLGDDNRVQPLPQQMLTIPRI